MDDKDRLASFILGARRLGIHLVFGFQNASLCPVEILSNCSAYYFFKTIDERDKQVIRRIAHINDEQARELPNLKPGECIALFPNSDWPYPIRCKTIEMQTVQISDEEVKKRSKAYASEFAWIPLDQKLGGEAQEPKDDQCQTTLDKACESFMQDVLNQEHEYSPAVPRFERCGIRSASLQQDVLKKCFSQGLIIEDRLPMNERGPSVVLYAPTELALERFGVRWKTTGRGRGKLSTRAGTFYAAKKIEQLPTVIAVIVEGEFAQKQIDILVRHDDGSASTIEIASTEKHECHNALHVVRNANDELRKHIVVCLGTETMNSVKKVFKNHPELHKNPKIEIILLSHVLSKERGWKP